MIRVYSICIIVSTDSANFLRSAKRPIFHLFSPCFSQFPSTCVNFSREMREKHTSNLSVLPALGVKFTRLLLLGAHLDTATNFGRAKLPLCPIFSRPSGFAYCDTRRTLRSPAVWAARQHRPTAVAVKMRPPPCPPIVTRCPPSDILDIFALAAVWC